MAHRLAALLAVLLSPVAAHAAPVENDWLDGLYARVAKDLVEGRPLVVQVHVPLCDNHIIRCGNARLGNGDDAEQNLYWGSDEGLQGWFGRKGSGWTRVSRAAPGGDVVAEQVWRRRFTPSARWRALGVKKPFDVYVVATAWRGSATDSGLETYVADLYGSRARAVQAGDVALAAGGAAHIVAYVGHNRWMDYPHYDWGAAARRAGAPGAAKGTIAVACDTADFLTDVPAAGRVPLLLTTDLMFAAAGSFEATVRVFADGGGYADMRAEAATGYADSEQKPVERVRGLFINPGDRRWHKAR